jgi:hypothetical protein
MVSGRYCVATLRCAHAHAKQVVWRGGVRTSAILPSPNRICKMADIRILDEAAKRQLFFFESSGYCGQAAVAKAATLI